MLSVSSSSSYTSAFSTLIRGREKALKALSTLEKASEDKSLTVWADMAPIFMQLQQLCFAGVKFLKRAEIILERDRHSIELLDRTQRVINGLAILMASIERYDETRLDLTSSYTYSCSRDIFDLARHLINFGLVHEKKLTEEPKNKDRKCIYYTDSEGKKRRFTLLSRVDASLDMISGVLDASHVLSGTQTYCGLVLPNLSKHRYILYPGFMETSLGEFILAAPRSLRERSVRVIMEQLVSTLSALAHERLLYLSLSFAFQFFLDSNISPAETCFRAITDIYRANARYRPINIDFALVPELAKVIIRNKYIVLHPANLVWQHGLILYAYLTRRNLIAREELYASVPYEEKVVNIAKISSALTQEEVRAKIREISTEDPLILDLLESMLQVDPTLRIDFDEILNHPFFKPLSLPIHLPISHRIEGFVFEFQRLALSYAQILNKFTIETEEDAFRWRLLLRRAHTVGLCLRVVVDETTLPVDKTKMKNLIDRILNGIKCYHALIVAAQPLKAEGVYSLLPSSLSVEGSRVAEGLLKGKDLFRRVIWDSTKSKVWFLRMDEQRVVLKESKRGSDIDLNCEVFFQQKVHRMNPDRVIPVLWKNGFNMAIGYSGETLIDYLEFAQEASSTYPLPQEFIQPVARGIIEALIALCRANVVHCDLKPENMVVDFPKKELRLIDFGLAVFKDKQVGNRGTPVFISPEVWTKFLLKERLAADFSRDTCAAGMILYEMYTFRHFYNDLLASKGLDPASKCIEPAHIFKNLTQEAAHWLIDKNVADKLLADLIKKMVQIHPSVRLSAEELLTHPYFSGEERPAGGAGAGSA